MQKYEMPQKDADEIAAFLRPMFQFDTEVRATAAQMLLHPWVSVTANVTAVLLLLLRPLLRIAMRCCTPAAALPPLHSRCCAHAAALLPLCACRCQ